MKRPLLIGFFILIVGSVMVFGSMPVLLKVKVQMANVRQEPDPNSSIVTQVAKGTELVAVAQTGNWYEISVLDKSGKTISAYIHVNTVEVSGGEKKTAEPEKREEARPERAERPRPAAKPAPRKSAAAASTGGIKLIAGFNSGRLAFSEALPPELTQKAKMGFVGGVGFESGGTVGFELNVLAAKGGTSFVVPTGEKFVLDGFGLYLPFMLKFRFLGGAGPYLMGGGSAGYLLSQKLKMVTPTETAEEDIIDDVNRFYYGLVFGGGYELAMDTMTLVFEIRYDLGLSNWFKEPMPGSWARSRVLNLLIGFRF